MSKFPSERIEALYGETPDEEVGDVSVFGWAGRYDGEVSTTIIREDSQGNITTHEGSPAEMAMTWADIEQELSVTEDPADEDYVIMPTRDGWEVRHIGSTGPEYDDAEAAIIADLLRPDHNVRPDVWLQDDHGGFTLISDSIYKRLAEGQEG